MSLIHWWPLIEDTRDIVGNTTLNTSSTTYDSGKIGQSLKLNLCEAYVVNPFINRDDWSLSFWVRNNNSTDWKDFVCFSNNGARIELYNGGVNWDWFSSNYNSGRLFTSGAHIGTNMLVNHWYHVAITKQGTEAILYLDGKMILTENQAANFTTASQSMHFCSRADIATGYYGNMNFNDIRCYDHTLSPVEIKELSKALILHYSFDDGFTTNYCDWRNITNIKTSGWQEAKSYNDGELTLTAINGWRCFMWEVNSALIGKNITFSFDAMVTDRSNAGYIYIQNMDSVGYGASLGDIPLTTTNWKRFTVHINSAAQYIGFNVRGVDETGKSLTLKVRNVKISNNLWDDQYSEYNVTYLPYNHSGTAQPTGVNINISNNSASGGKALDCKDTWLYTAASTIQQEKMTLTAWVNPRSFVGDCIIIGGCYLCVNSAGKLSVYNYDKQPAGYHNGTTVLPLNEWSHIAAVWDATHCIGYVNGKQEFKIACTGTVGNANHSKKDIGSEYGTQRKFDGLIDDVRVYNEALDAIDIQNLYESKAYITNYGDIISHEFNSRSTEAQITSKYEVKCTEIVENSAEYNMLDYVNFSSAAPGIDTGVAPGRNLVFDTTISKISGSNPYIITQGNYGLRVGGSQFVNFVYGKRFRSSKDISQKNSIQGSDSYLVVSDSLGTQETDSDSPSGNVILFKNQGNIVTSGYLYKCTLMNQDIVVRDFIPVQRKSDDAIGLLDLIENKFYTCSGISAGPLKASTEALIFEDGHISGREIIEL